MEMMLIEEGSHGRNRFAERKWGWLGDPTMGALLDAAISLHNRRFIVEEEMMKISMPYLPLHCSTCFQSSYQLVVSSRSVKTTTFGQCLSKP
jgi:hypothetical protein